MHERTAPCCPRCELPLAGDPLRHASLACPEPYCDYVVPLREPAARDAALEPRAPSPGLRLAG